MVGEDTCKITWILVWSPGLVSNGKPTLGGRTPAESHHYQLLPPGLIRSDTPEDLASMAPTVASGGGAKHRSIDPPSAWHSVADPHAASTMTQGGHPGLDPTTTSYWAYDVYSHTEATQFGKEFLRMAGIVQMLLALWPPHDKYPYANPEGIRQAGNTRDQTRSSCTVSTAVPGPCATVLAVSHCKAGHRVLTCPVWPILPNLLTATHYIVSVHNCI